MSAPAPPRTTRKAQRARLLSHVCHLAATAAVEFAAKRFRVPASIDWFRSDVRPQMPSPRTLLQFHQLMTDSLRAASRNHHNLFQDRGALFVRSFQHRHYIVLGQRVR
jgi:hypothetical protein